VCLWTERATGRCCTWIQSRFHDYVRHEYGTLFDRTEKLLSIYCTLFLFPRQYHVSHHVPKKLHHLRSQGFTSPCRNITLPVCRKTTDTANSQSASHTSRQQSHDPSHKAPTSIALHQHVSQQPSLKTQGNKMKIPT